MAPDNSGGAPGDAALADTTIRTLSPEARQVFREAQENIVQLNKSRLRALEELRNAKQKIAELEAKLEEAVTEAASASRQVAELQARTLSSASLLPTADDAEPAAAAAVSWAPQEEPAATAEPAAPVEPAAAVEPAAVAEPAPSEEGPSVTVVYSTGWQSAFLHYNADGKGWTQLPGERMGEGSGRYPGTKMLTLWNAHRVEFVITDGTSDWDHPNPYSEDGQTNYVADGPGVWRLKNGKLAKVE